MSNNGASGHGQFPNYNNNPQGVPLYPQTPNTLKRKLPAHLTPPYPYQQQSLQQQRNFYGGSPEKQIKLEPRGNGVPIAVPAMFNPNQGQQGQNIQQPQQMIFQGQGLQQNAPQQNVQGQPGQQPQPRRMPVSMTEEDRQKYVSSVKSIIERFGAESPQAKQAQRQLGAMMQYIHQQNRAAQQGQPTQGSDAQAAAQGRPGMGHSVSSPAQFQPPPNADPQKLHSWRLNLTSRYTQGQQRMKQIREQLQIQSQQMNQLTQAGQTHESPQIIQIKANMNEFAKQFKTIEGWCAAAKNSGHILQNPIQQPNRPQQPAGAVTGGAGGGQQQGGVGAVQMQQQSSSMGVEQQGQQQNIGNQQQAQPQQGQMVPLQQVPQQQQQQAHQMPQQVPQQVPGMQQHPPPQQRPAAPQQTNQVPNTAQHVSAAVANRQQQPLVRPSMSPTAQAPMPQPMHQSPAMSPQHSQQGIQQGQQPLQQQMPRQTPVPVQQVPGGPQAVRQSPAPGTPATPTAQHPQQQQVRDASVPPRPGSAASAPPAVQGQVPVMPQQGQQLPPQPGQQQQVPPRTGGASAQSPPPQQQIPQLPDRNLANRMPIPKTLNIEPKGPVPIQTRPTLSGGANTAGSHVMGTPALVKNPAFEFDEGGMGLMSKRKLEELVKQIDPDEKLDPEVEESVLELVDEFIDTVVSHACKMAKLRGSDTLDIKDMQIILERNWNIRVPGYAADEIRTVRKFAPAQGYVQKMNALAAGKALNQTNLKGGD